MVDIPGNIALADQVKGSNSFMQRGWRLTWRVPHYKSCEELAKMVAEAQTAKKP